MKCRLCSFWNQDKKACKQDFLEVDRIECLFRHAFYFGVDEKKMKQPDKAPEWAEPQAEVNPLRQEQTRIMDKM